MSHVFTVADVIKRYMELRAKKEQIEAETKERLGKIKEKQAKLEAWLKMKADEDGVTSFKTEYGTAFMTTNDYANVADWDAVLSFVKENDAYDMLQKRVSKDAVRSYIESHNRVPPGVSYGHKIDVNIRRPTREN